MKRLAWTAMWIGLLVAGCDGGGPSGEPCALDEDCGPCEACVQGHCQATAPSEVCGDDLDNDCDGATDEGCAECGNQDPEGGEACDDGNTADGDYCSADCQTVTGRCGDGIHQDNEVCDFGTETAPAECQPDLQTDPDHCGSCERACPAGMECLGGACLQELASGQAGIRALAQDADHLYWVTRPTCDVAGNQIYDGSVMRVPKAGGSAEPLATGRGAPVDLVLDESDVYWIDQGTGQDDQGIYRVPEIGGAAVPVATGMWATGLALDSDSVYWSEESAGGSRFMREAKDGGQGPTELFTAGVNPRRLQVDELGLLWVGMNDMGMDVIYRRGLVDAESRVFEPNLGTSGIELALDAEAVYAHHYSSDPGEVSIVRLLKDGSERRNVALLEVPSGCQSQGLALEGARALWLIACEHSAAFQAAPKATGAAEDLVSLPWPVGRSAPFVADPDGIYLARVPADDGRCPPRESTIYKILP
jgi:cysteine-rich repeat protein